jgi:hypothetical protein
MNQETLNALKDLAGKLGTTAEHLWSVLIRQAYVSFATDLFLYAAASVAIYALIKGARELFKIEENPFTQENPALIFAIVLGVVAVAISGMVLIQIPHTITKIINPEYWALMQVLDAIKGVK